MIKVLPPDGFVVQRWVNPQGFWDTAVWTALLKGKRVFSPSHLLYSASLVPGRGLQLFWCSWMEVVTAVPGPVMALQSRMKAKGLLPWNASCVSQYPVKMLNVLRMRHYWFKVIPLDFKTVFFLLINSTWIVMYWMTTWKRRLDAKFLKMWVYLYLGTGLSCFRECDQLKNVDPES